MCIICIINLLEFKLPWQPIATPIIISIHVQSCKQLTYTHTHTHTYIHTHTHTYTYTHTHTYIHTHTHTYTYTHTHTYTYTHTHTHIHTHTHTHAHAHICTHTHTHAHTTVQFHAGHLHHLLGQYAAAKRTYEGVLSSKLIPNDIRALTLKQLGKNSSTCCVYVCMCMCVCVCVGENFCLPPRLVVPYSARDMPPQ